MSDTTKREKFEFKVGDIVEFAGDKGKVSYIKNRHPYPITVSFFNEKISPVVFTIDGKLHAHHTESLLKLIERPKKKVPVERRVNVYKDFISTGHASQQLADNSANSDRIACVKLTGTYEVEVE